MIALREVGRKGEMFLRGDTAQVKAERKNSRGQKWADGQFSQGGWT